MHLAKLYRTNNPISVVGVVVTFDVDLWQQLVDPRGYPPVAIAEKLHCRWHQNHTYDRGVNKNCNRQTQTEKF
jgi:hypothetical protein